MGLVSLISKYVTVLFIMILILGLIVGVIAYYLLKVKKVASREEQFDYTKFERRDSLDYVRFQQIINAVENKTQTQNGLIVADNGYRYIAGLKVSGYNFFSASAQEQKQSMVGMLSFLNTIEGDIQYRQSTKAIDLSDNIDDHRKRLKEVALEIEGLKLDHQDLVTQSEQYLDNAEIYDNYDKKLNEIERTIRCKQQTEQELDIVIQYMEALSGTNIESEKVQCWLFEWSYNSNDYTEDLTDEERYDVAAQNLTTKANSYIAALSRTGVTCERMTGEELLELFRYHYSPITADAYSITDLYNSSVNALYVSSDSLNDLEQEAKDEKAYYDMVNKEREEEYAQEGVEQLEETMELFTDEDEQGLVVSDQSVDTVDTPHIVSEDTSEEMLNELYEDDGELVIDTDDFSISESDQPDDYDYSMIKNLAPDADAPTPIGFEFGKSTDDEDELDLIDISISADEEDGYQPLEGETVDTEEAPVKKKRFHREKKEKKEKKAKKLPGAKDGQMNIFDNVPFGNI